MEGCTPMFDPLLERACAVYAEGAEGSPAELAERLMELEGLPMHCPEHHFIVPAALLLAAHRAKGSPAAAAEAALRTAQTRAKTVPGGFCGNCGCCGAAVGTGIFLSIWLGVNPKSEENWSLVNRITADALGRVASVEGPRCCKRVTHLALEAAADFCRRELSLELGEAVPGVCRHFSRSRECRGKACPYFPSRAG